MGSKIANTPSLYFSRTVLWYKVHFRVAEKFWFALHFDRFPNIKQQKQKKNVTFNFADLELLLDAKT